MSTSLEVFEHAIKDATELLEHFDKLNIQPPPPEIEVLKRASLVMALAALETFIEDRINEAVEQVIGQGTEKSKSEIFYKESLDVELKSFHTPTSEKIKKLFEKYLGFDVTEGWIWNNYEPARARAKLNELAKKRGDIAHRSLRPTAGQAVGHAVTRDDLEKNIRFIKSLVDATDRYIASKLSIEK